MNDDDQVVVHVHIGTAVVATRSVVLFTEREKKKRCVQLFVVSCFLFLWALLSRTIKASGEVACAEEMMMRCCICTWRRRKEKKKIKRVSTSSCEAERGEKRGNRT